MKKILFLVVALLLTSVSAIRAADNTKLYDAIEKSDVEEFRKQFKRVQPLTKREKDKLLDEAEEIVDNRKARVSVFRSGWDATKAIGGTVLGILGLVCLAHGLGEVRKAHGEGHFFAAGGAFAGVYGFYKAFRGFTCHTAQTRLNAALTIEKAIDKADITDAKTTC